MRILALAADYLGGKGCGSPRLDAELLLAEVLGCARLDLYLDPHRPLDEVELDRFRRLLSARAAGLPVARILGRKEFWSLELELNQATLVPRPETELLVEKALERVSRTAMDAPRILDLGTGAGGVAIALAKEVPNASVVATDISEAAAQAAASNAKRFEVDQRVEVLVGDLLEPVQGRTFDMVLMNPPYLTTKELADAAPEVRTGDPGLALDGGEDGLRVYRRLLASVKSVLADGGGLLMEVASARSNAVRRLSEAAGLRVTAVHKDLAGLERVVEAEFV